MKGRRMTEETKKKISIGNTGIKRPNSKPPHFFGEKSSHWKGDNIGYSGLHQWIRLTFGKATKCEYKNCKYPRQNKAKVWVFKPKRFEWANINGKYKRDREDWVQLCPSCHRKFDIGLIKL